MENLFSVFVNLCESCLFFYLICHRLTCKAWAKRWIIIGILGNTVLVTVMNHISPSLGLSMVVFSGCYIILTYLFMEGKHVKKILCGLLFPIIARTSDLIIISATRFITGRNLEILFNNDISYMTMSGVYILLVSMFIFLISHTGRRPFILPFGLTIALPIIICIWIVSSDIILTHIERYESFFVQQEIVTLYGCLVANLFVFLCCIIFVIYISRTYQKNIILTEENKIQQLEQQQYNAILDGVETIRYWRHDFSQHLGVIGNFIEQGQIKDAEEYIEKLSNNMQQSVPIVSTGNYIIDAVLSSKMNAIRQCGIHFTYQVIIPFKLPLEDTDVCSVVGNVLDNAIEACKKLGGTEYTYINLLIKPYKRSLLMKLVNSSTGEYQLDSAGFPLSTKPNGSHGMGLKRVKQIVDSANGFCSIIPEKDSFTVGILIPLITGERKNAV